MEVFVVAEFVWAEIYRYGLPLSQSPAPERAVWRALGQRFEGTAEELFALVDPGMARSVEDARQWFPRPYEPLTAAGLTAFHVREVIEIGSLVAYSYDHESLVDGTAYRGPGMAVQEHDPGGRLRRQWAMRG